MYRASSDICGFSLSPEPLRLRLSILDIAGVLVPVGDGDGVFEGRAVGVEVSGTTGVGVGRLVGAGSVVAVGSGADVGIPGFP
jgi:hypothetical protein